VLFLAGSVVVVVVGVVVTGVVVGVDCWVAFAVAVSFPSTVWQQTLDKSDAGLVVVVVLVVTVAVVVVVVLVVSSASTTTGAVPRVAKSSLSCFACNALLAL